MKYFFALQAEKSFNSSLSSLSVESLDNEDEDLLALCISSAMPKSKSEHFDLAGKGKRNRKSPRREKARSAEKSRSRTSSKSPRNSRVIPGTFINFLLYSLNIHIVHLSSRMKHLHYKISRLKKIFIILRILNLIKACELWLTLLSPISSFLSSTIRNFVAVHYFY